MAKIKEEIMNNKRQKKILAGTFFIGFLAFAPLTIPHPPSTIHYLCAMEIPLEGFGKGATVATVNIHKVFEAFPETEKARIELNQLIARKKDDISAKREEIA